MIYPGIAANCLADVLINNAFDGTYLERFHESVRPNPSLVLKNIPNDDFTKRRLKSKPGYCGKTKRGNCPFSRIESLGPNIMLKAKKFLQISSAINELSSIYVSSILSRVERSRYRGGKKASDPVYFL